MSEFRTTTKIGLTTNLKAKILIGKEGLSGVKYDFLMKGKAKKNLNNKRPEITRFIKQKLYPQYIPSIRTSELAIQIVESLLQRELATLESNVEYKEVIKTLNKLQQPIAKRIAKSLKESINSFIPDVRSIKIKSRESVGRILSSSCKVFIDDGIETELKLKGDGVISLTAISLLQYLSKQGSLDRGLILLLEEPESHLHPKAIHSLKKVINEISKTNQVILTTHSSIIVDRTETKNNILVESGKAAPALTISAIRDSLGIQLSDNLSNAYIVLLVEGEEDKKILNTWLNAKSRLVKDSIHDGRLVIDHLGGATNVSYKASLYKNNLCNVIAFLDDDESGRKGITDAREKGTLNEDEYVLAHNQGMKDSEIEDLIMIGTYRNEFIDKFGVDINNPRFKTNGVKWSDRVKEIFKLNGKLWSDKLESEIKRVVADCVEKEGITSLNQHKTNSIDALQNILEFKLQKK